MFAKISDHFLGDIAFIKAIASGNDCYLPTLARMRSLGLDHSFKSIGKTRKANRLAWPVKRSVGFQPVLLVRRPSIDKIDVPLDRSCRAPAQGETLLRVLDSAHRNLLEGHRSPAFQYG